MIGLNLVVEPGLNWWAKTTTPAKQTERNQGGRKLRASRAALRLVVVVKKSGYFTLSLYCLSSGGAQLAMHFAASISISAFL